MEITIKDINKMRKKLYGSSKTVIPQIVVPTIPIPVHTAYAVPTGIVLTATDKKYTLRTIAIKTTTVGNIL